MGMWDEMCLVCGGPPHAPHDYDLEDGDGRIGERERNFLSNLEGSSEWLDTYVGIPETEEVVVLGEYNSYGSFKLPNYPHKCFHGATNFTLQTVPDGHPYGLTCHEKCYSLLQRELKYSIRFCDVWPLLVQQEMYNFFDWSTYGGMSAYHDQSFLFMELLSEGNAWMLQDPTASAANAERILEVWRPLLENGFKQTVSKKRDTEPPRRGQVAPRKQLR